MSDTNITLLTGNLTRTPELRYTPNGVADCEFRSGEQSSLPAG